MSKLTSVEWLHQTWGNYPDLWTWEKIEEWFEQAKEMHKQEILNSFDHGQEFDYNQYHYNGSYKTYAEQYYNETFKTDVPKQPEESQVNDAGNLTND